MTADEKRFLFAALGELSDRAARFGRDAMKSGYTDAAAMLSQELRYVETLKAIVDNTRDPAAVMSEVRL
jgi:hypothetical protein